MALEMPDVSNMTDEQLVDALGEVNETVKQFERMAGYYKEALKSRDGDVFQGRTYSVMVSSRSRTGLDQTAIKAEMGPDWVAEHSKTTEFKQLNITRRDV